MKPTPRLRWIKRWEIDLEEECEKQVQVLQQWWEPSCQEGCTEIIDFRLPTERYIKNIEGAGEWRDVPVENENG